MVYEYDGPVYSVNDKELGLIRLSTTASSGKAAIRNIRGNAAKKFLQKVVYIDNSLVKEVNSEENYGTLGKPLVDDPNYNFEETDLDESITFNKTFDLLNNSGGE